jgi:hypothetical protein
LRTWKSCAEEGIALYRSCEFIKAEELLVESVRRARNEKAAPEHTAEALNNLAIGYSGRAKYQDATNALREAYSLTQGEKSQAERLQKVLSMHIRSQLYLEQEHFADAKNESVLALQMLGNALEYLSCEFWYNLARAYLGLGRRKKAFEAVDNFLLSAGKLKLIDNVYPIYNDPVISFTYFGPGWEVENVSEEQFRVENDVRALLLKASLSKLLYAPTKQFHDEALKQCEFLGPHHLTAETYFLVSRRYAFNDRDWDKAHKYCREALEIVEKIYGESHPILPVYLLNRACLTSIGDTVADYQPLMDRAFEIINNSFGTRHPKRARYQLMYCSLMPMVNPGGKDFLTRQEEAAYEALNGVLDFFDDNHSLVIAARLQIAEILIRDGRNGEAEELLRQILADAGTLIGSQPHHMIATISELLNLAEYLPDVERYAIWELVITAIGKLDISLYEDDPGRQIDLLRSSAYIQNRTNSPGAAEELLKRAYELAKDLDPDLARDCKVDLICLFQREKDYDRALELLQEEDPDASLRHKLTQSVRLADVLCSLDRNAEAEQLALSGLTQSEQLLSEFADPFLNFFRVLFDLYIEQNRLDDAVRMLGVMTSNNEHYSSTSRDLLPIFLRRLAEAYAIQSDHRAEKYFAQAIDAADVIRGRSPQVLDSCFVSMAEYFMQTGKLEPAHRLHTYSLELREEVFGADSYWTAVAMFSVAELSMELDLDRALQLSKRALEIIDVEPPRDEEYLLAAYQVRALILERSPQRLDAVVYHERARKLEEKLSRRKEAAE